MNNTSAVAVSIHAVSPVSTAACANPGKSKKKQRQDKSIPELFEKDNV
jgi:hypothetical protein